MVTRIRQLLEHKQLTPTQFADHIGVGRPVMSHILSGRNKPSLEVVQRIISAFPELSLPWLLSGTGDMLAAIPPTAASGTSPATEKPTSAPVPTPPAADIVQPEEPATAPAAPQTVPSAQEAPLAAAPLAATSASAPALPATPLAAPAPVVPRPFRRAARREGSASAAPLAAVAPVALAVPPASLEPVAPLPAPLPASGPASVAPAAPSVLAATGAALLPFLAEPGKAIRRIVIFYRDGSFADYQPEQ